MKGVKISMDSTLVTHLIFANDLIICCNATNKVMEAISSVLTKYKTGLGQITNKRSPTFI